MEAVLNDEIDEIQPGNFSDPEEKGWFYKQLLGEFESMHGDRKKSLKIYENSIPESPMFHHQNLAFYIQRCWNTHAGLVMRPDMFYFTIFNHIAKFVIDHKEECRHIFTDKPYKQDIVIVQDTTQCINFKLLTAALKDKIPTCVTDLLPEFSTDTDMSLEARLASFAEAASPYYNYFTTVCGIKKVRVEGTEKDWSSIVTALEGWQKLLTMGDIKKYLGRALEICKSILGDVCNKSVTKSFWQGIYFEEFCGSGHPQLTGWILDLYNLPPKSTAPDLVGHVTNVEWTVVESQQKFVVHHGLFYSNLDDSKFLVPQFSRIVFAEKMN